MRDWLLSPKGRYFTVAALRWLPTGLVAPLTVLFMRERGLSLASVGLVMALYSATAIVLELPTGGLADAIGRRQTLVMAGLVGIAAHAALLGAHSLAGFGVAWVLVGIDRALDSGALEAWYVDEVRRIDPECEIRGGLSGAGAVLAVSIAVGSLVGGYLPRLAPEWWREILSPLALPLVAALFVHAVRVVATFLLIAEDRPVSFDAFREGVLSVPANVRGGIALAARSRVVASLVLTVVAGGFALSSVENLWQPRFASLLGGVGERTTFFGALSAAAFLVGAGGSLASPLLVKAFGGRLARTAAFTEVCMGLLVVALGAAAGVAGASLTFAGFYVFVGLLDPVHRELVHSQVGSEQRTTMLSLDNFALQIGGVGGSLVLATLAHARGIPAAWTVGGAVLAVGGLFYLRADRALEPAGPALQDV